jgi:hypothetical protein
MKRYLIQIGTVTYAIKARDLLKRKGYKVKIERKAAESTHGCGYVIIFSGDIVAAQKTLSEKCKLVKNTLLTK